MNGSDEPNMSAQGVQSSSTSQGLLERLKARDEEAWHRLIDLYAPLVYRWCRRWDLAEPDAADVFQDVFQAVATHIDGFRKEKAGDTFRGWLFTITQNKVRDHFRKRAHEPGGEGGTEAQMRFLSLPASASRAGDESAEPQDDAGLFSRALALVRGEFEARTWRAFWQTAVDERSPDDVALELGMSPGAVRVAKSRVLRRLREELGEL
jgi:RNA polymerase sigma-70 factor, ECF subfamily